MKDAIRRRNRLRPLFAALLAGALLLAAPGARGEYYKYIDRNGRPVFVDDPSKIPPEYRQKRQSYAEELDHLSPPERQAVREKERQERQTQEERRREAQAEAARKAAEQALETPVRVRGNQVLVPVQAGYGGNRVTLTLLLDTGASRTVLHRGAVQSLQLARGDAAYGQVAGGGLIKSEIVKLHYLRVGPFEAQGVPVMLIDTRGPEAGFDGLLGMDFLRQLNFRIDYQRQVIRWQP